MKKNYRSGYRSGFGDGSLSQDWHFGFEYCKTCKEVPVGRRFLKNTHKSCEVYSFKGWVERPSKKQLKNNSLMKKFEEKFCTERFRK